MTGAEQSAVVENVALHAVITITLRSTRKEVFTT